MNKHKRKNETFARGRKGRKGRTPSQRFDPDRDYINRAIDDYIKKGGKIKRVVIEDYDLDVIINNTGDRPADDWLLSC
jgi:hypothetical protein